MAHTCEYETVKLDGITLSRAVEGVGVGLGLEVCGSRVGVGGNKGVRIATGDICEAGCDGFAFGVAATLLQSCVVSHLGSNEALCASIREEFINVRVTIKEMTLNTMMMPSRSVPNRRIPFHFGNRGGVR